jgi:hypothetical protein
MLAYKDNMATRVEHPCSDTNARAIPVLCVHSSDASSEPCAPTVIDGDDESYTPTMIDGDDEARLLITDMQHHRADACRSHSLPLISTRHTSCVRAHGSLIALLIHEPGKC